MRAILFITLLFYCLVVTDAWRPKCTKTVYKFPHTTTLEVTVVTAPVATKTVTDFIVKTTFSTIPTTFTLKPATLTIISTSVSTSISTSISTDITTTTESTTTLATVTTTTTTTTTAYTKSYNDNAPAAAIPKQAKKLNNIQSGSINNFKLLSPNYKKRSPSSPDRHQRCKTVTHWIDHTKTKTKTVKVASETVERTIRPTTTTTETSFTTTIISLDQATTTTTTTTTTTSETDTTTTSPTTTILTSTSSTTITATRTKTAINYPFCDPSTFKTDSDVETYSEYVKVDIHNNTVSAADCCKLCGNAAGCISWSWFGGPCAYDVLKNRSQCGTSEAQYKFISHVGVIAGMTPCGVPA